MFNIIVRVIIIYLIVIALMRLMGKRQIGEMEPFELVITLIIADLATIPMAEQTIPIWYGVIPLATISIVHFVFSLISQKSPTMRDIISGKPVIVIDEGKINFVELKNLNMSCDELLEQLRNLNYFDIGTINYAIIERNGKITVIPKTQNMPATRQDLKLMTPENDVMYCIVENGRILKKNFKEMGILHDAIMPIILHKIGGSTTVIRDISFASMSESGDVFLQAVGGVAQDFKIDIPKSARTNASIKENAQDIKAEKRARFA